MAGVGDAVDPVPRREGLPRQPRQQQQEVRAHHFMQVSICIKISYLIYLHDCLQPNCQPGLQLLCPEAHEHSARQEELQLEGRVQEPQADVREVSADSAGLLEQERI